MPTFRISVEDCESDGRYNGHNDLLLKRLSFQTLRPFEIIRSTKVHTLLSKTFRNLQNCVSEQLSCQDGSSNNAVKTSFLSQVPTNRSPVKHSTQSPEKIAEYYIEKASSYLKKQFHQKVIGMPSNDISRVPTYFPSSPSNTLLNTPVICEESLPSSSLSRKEEQSFSFLGTPAVSMVVPEPLKEFTHLSDYTGSRPSFGMGTTTSTPFSKKFTAAAQIQKDVVQKSDNDIHLTIENRFNECDTAIATANSLEDCYTIDMKLAEDYDQAKKRVERSKEQKVLRVQTKRTVVEKVTVESKKTATEQELHAVSGFLCKLLTGQQVSGYGNKLLQLTDGDLIWYGMIVTIESYMGVLERDPKLAVVISRILVMISCAVPHFESVLLAKLFRTSHLLALHEEKCTSFAEHLVTIEDRRFALLPEMSIIKLFFHLHFIGSKFGKITLFTSEVLWRVVSFLTDKKPRVLATAIMLSEIVLSGVEYMREMNPQRWSQFLEKLGDTLLPSIEMEVDKNDIRRSAGEDTIVSGLRHAVLRHRNT